MKHYWYGIITEGSPCEGEEFFVGADNKAEADAMCADLFPGETLEYFGRVSDYEAECMGLDEY